MSRVRFEHGVDGPMFEPVGLTYEYFNVQSILISDLRLEWTQKSVVQSLHWLIAFVNFIVGI